MSSKLRRWGLLLGGALTAATLMVGCDKYFRPANSEQNSNKNVIKVQAKQLECMKSVPQQMINYIEDKADVSETHAIFSCLDGVLDTFNRFAAGDTNNNFSADDLRQFVNRYVNLKNQISADFMSELMKMKSFLVGGAPDLVTRTEIVEIRGLLKMFESVAQDLRGHGRILSFRADRTQVTEQQISDTQKLVQKSLNTILKSSKAGTVSYTWEDFEGLAKGLNDFLQTSQWMSNLMQYLPLADAVRTLFLGAEDFHPNLQAWQQDVNWTSRAYALVARYYYLLHDLDPHLTSTWKEMIRFSDDSLEILQASPQMVNHELFEAPVIDQVIDQLYELKIAGPPLTADMVKSGYREILVRLAEGNRGTTLESASVRGLDKSNIALLVAEYNVWKAAEFSIIDAMGDQNSMLIPKLMARVNQLDLDQVLTQVKNPPDQKASLLHTLTDWRSLIGSDHPLVPAAGFGLRLDTDPQKESLNIMDVTCLNFLRSMARVFLIGYGDPVDDQVQHNTMSEKGISTWLSDFNDTVLALHLKDPRSPTTAQRMFDDSRFFTFHGDAGTKLTQTELVEELAMMISGGMSLTNKQMKDLGDDGCLLDERDTGFNQPLVKTDCFKNSMKKRFAQTYQNMPALVGEIQSGRLNFDQVFDQLQLIAAIPQHRPATTEYAEIRQMNVVLEYVESLMSVYDVDQDQMLSENELLQAFHNRFYSVIVSLNPTHETGAQTAFLYVVYKGEMPDTSSGWKTFLTGASFTGFALRDTFTTLPPISRLDLLKVISLLKQKTSSNVTAQ